MKKTITTLLAAATLSLSSAAFAEDNHTEIAPEGFPRLAPYTPGIVTSDGTLYVAGNIAYRNGAIPAHAVDGENDIADQAKIVMDNIGVILDLAGYTYDDAVRVVVYLQNMDDYGAFNEVYGTYWPEGTTPPSRVAVEVGKLPGNKPGAPVLVEVSMIAHK